MARKKQLAAALLSLGCLQAVPVWALGLGELTLQSFLNEPLKARVSLLDIGNLHEDQIRVRLAAPDDFDRLGVDRAYFLTGIKFEVDIDSSGRGVIVLTSDDPVLEPYLDFIVEARWPSGRLLRNYTVLVDPPAFDTRSPVVSASERVSAIEGVPAPAAAEKKTDAEVQTSGTRVSMRQSGLAPGAMPEREFSAGTAAEPAPGARYMIRRDETLWTIAQRARVDGVSVQQTMLEIQRLNPDAFIDGNINRIKAGFIIYLPASGDISDADVEAALAAVRQQNEDWRAGRASAPAAAGPALRISSGEEEPEAESAAEPAPAAPVQSSSTDAATRDELQRSERERDELGERLAALADRLETLERIVELKDAQIASLQQALAAAESGSPESPDPATVVGVDTAGAAETASGASGDDKPAVKTPSAQEAPSAPASGGFGSWLYLIVGVVVAALLGLLFWRRRGAEKGEGEGGIYDAARPVASGKVEADAFADIELRDSELDLDEDDGAAAPPGVASAGGAGASGQEDAPERTGQRGYGERKHDQYASDVEAGDALAEADIYIAYGRYNQAMDLLRKALRSEPENTAYRLKLLELAAETGDRGEADYQLGEIQRAGDQDAIARAEAIIASKPISGNPYLETADVAEEAVAAPEPAAAEPEPEPEPVQQKLAPLAPAAEDLSGQLGELDDLASAGNRDELGSTVDEEADFLGLEIEGSPAEELDVSTDLGAGRGRSDSSDEDFVFADDGDPLSTKLDLARAYIDMGDDDGARQILEEVVAEGSDEHQREARELLDRLG